MNKKILILHGWDASPEAHWFSKAKRLFQENGDKVFIPQMPGEYFPKKEEWVKVIEKFKPDDNWILIGHSLGGVAILKYLEKCLTKIDKAILIATPYEPMQFNPIANFFDGGFNWEKIKTRANKFIVLNETDDPLVPVEHGKNYAQNLDAKFHLLPGGTHFHIFDLEFLKGLIS